jgi:hypothetical protein
MKLSAPSIANRTAIERPIPESPPVMMARLPLSLPAALYFSAPPSGVGSSSTLGKGSSLDSRPGAF